MSKKIALIGANGQLGFDLQNIFADSGYELFNFNGPPEGVFDIVDKDLLKRTFNEIKPQIVINTAAFTDVPGCEIKKELAYSINTEGAKNVAEICRDNGSVLIHISTDYVFDGEKKSPYVETDKVNPLNYYGYTKKKAEDFIKNTLEKYYILRTSGLYGKKGSIVKKGNFVFNIIEKAKKGEILKIVTDEVLTPTSSQELAFQIKKICDTLPEYGIYHTTNQGECSWYEFAVKIFSILSINVEIIPVYQKDLPQSVVRPKYSVLENSNLKKLGLDVFSHWEKALQDFLTSL